MSKLPEGWVEVLLGDIAEVISGIGFPKEFQGEESGDLPFFKVGDISRAVLNNRGYLSETENYVSQETARKLKGKPLKPGTTVFAKIGEAIKLSRRAFVQSPCLVDNNVMGVKAHDNQLDRLLFLFLQTQDFSDLSRATTVPSLRKGDVESLVFRLPPLAEQKRIADKLDALLARVDACRARLDRVPLILKRFRQAVLAAATSGQLTEDWREGDGDISTEFSEASFTTIDKGLFNLPRSWQWVSLESICEYVVDCPHSTPKWADSGYICVRTTNFKPGYLDLSEVSYVTEQTYQQRIERLKPKSGDVLYSREGGILGIACIIPPEIELCLGQRMMLMRTYKSYLPTLLMSWLNSPEILKLVRGLTSGSASPHLNVKEIRNFPTPLPPPAEQHEIVRRVETLFAFAERLAARYQTARRQVEQLTPALLAQAFRGELVPQDAKDEPAAALLERMRERTR